ncbi:MAG: hypothetical protein JSU04_04185, partial [Bdellovibrionales bacterium]|nr:hypothetical protein [Bdellovibrionales bacterium]
LQTSGAFTNYVLTLPNAQGGANTILQNNGTGVLSWVSNAANVNNAASLTNGKMWLGNSGNVAVEVAMSGDATISNAGLLSLKSTGTAGTYWKVITDAQGRVTSGSALASGDVTTALGYTPASANAGYVNGGNTFAGNATIGLNDNYNLGIKTAGSTRMTIDNTGNVGVGTTSPLNKLDVNGGVAIGSYAGTNAAPSNGLIVSGQTLIGSSTDFTDTLGPHSLAVTGPDAKNIFAISNSAGTVKASMYLYELGTDQMQFGTITNSNFGFFVNNGTPQLSINTNGGMTVGTYANTGTFAVGPANGLAVSGSVGIGTSSPATKLDVNGSVRVGTDATSCAAGIAGAIRYNAGNVEYCNGTSWTAFAAAGAGITSLNGLTGSSQTFATPGTSGNAPAWSFAGSTHTLNIPMASASGSVTAGLLSNTDYAAFNSKMSSALPSTQVWVGNASGAAAAVSLGGDVASITNAGVVTLKSVGTAGTYWKVVTDAQGRVTSGGALASGDVTTALGYTPASSTAGYVNGGNSFTGNATIGLNDNYNLGIKTGGSTRMTVTSAGYVGVGTTTPGTIFTVKGVSGPITPSLSADGGAMTIDNGGDLQLQIGEATGAPSVYLQSKRSTNDGTAWPIALNPLGGNVGIGTANPKAALDIAANSIHLQVVTPGTSATDEADINLVTLSNGNVLGNAGNKGWQINGKGNAYTGQQNNFGISYWNGSAWANNFSMLPSGYVGIGTAAPGYTLDMGSRTDAVRLPSGLDATRPSNAAGLIRYNTTSNVVEFNNGSGWNALASAGASITTLNGLTAASQTFAIGTSGNSPAFSSATATHTLNIPMASASGSVTAGLISNTDYAAFNSKMSSALPSTQVWVGNASGAAAAVSLGGDISSITNAGSVTLNKTTTGVANKILSLDGSSIGTMSGLALTNTGTVTLSAQTSSSTYGLKWPAAAPTGNQFLQVDSSGNFTWVSNAPSIANKAALTNGSIWVGNASGIAVELTPGTANNILYGSSTTAWASGTADTAGIVDKSSTQTISGAKTFSSTVTSSIASGSTAFDAGNGNIKAGSGGTTTTGGGQIYAGGYASATNTIDFNKGNVQTTSYDCAAVIQLNNMQSGGSYTLVVTGGSATKCTFNDGGGATFSDTSFAPTNAARTASSHTVYTFVKIGARVYVSWIPGFGTAQ